MTNQEIRQKADIIANFLEKKQLKNAFDHIALLIQMLGDWSFKEQLEELETTYKYMLRYMLDGVSDPERDKVHRDLIRSTLELADKVILHLKDKSESGLFYQNRRNTDLYHTPSFSELTSSLDELSTKISLSDLLEENQQAGSTVRMEKQMEEVSGQMFRKLWLSEHLTEEDTRHLQHFLQSKLIPCHIQCITISALTLSLKELFDKDKLILLLEACEAEETEIRQRALVGLLLVLYQYDKRMHLYPEACNRIQHLAEDRSFIKNIHTIIRQFILTKETEKISKRITEELMPEMLKISPQLSQKINLSDLMDDGGMEDKNPEWQDMLDEAGLTDKLQEINDLQMEGADVMHSSFSNLKTYPFFYEMANWFMPFTSKHSALENNQDSQINSLIDVFNQLGYMCNSDKYSLYFSILQMPESYRKMMSSQMISELAEMVKQQKEDQLVYEDKKQETISSQYIHDLYRFYKVYPRRNDFEDIFASPLTFHQTESIGKLISDKESLLSIGTYYFSKDHFKEAKDIFLQLANRGEADAMLFQKTGYCEQMTGNISLALDAYLKSDLIESGNPWTLKKIAACYRLLKNPEEALAYYQKVEIQNPDNLSVQLNIGHCYLELKKYQEALKSYFKVEYLSKNGSKAWRPIAWCSFLTGKYEQSVQYYEQLMNDKPEMPDYLNYGHAQLAMGNTKKAIELYLQAIDAPDGSQEKFVEAFNADIPELIHAGIKDYDIPIILDQVLYAINKH